MTRWRNGETAKGRRVIAGWDSVPGAASGPRAIGSRRGGRWRRWIKAGCHGGGSPKSGPNWRQCHQLQPACHPHLWSKQKFHTRDGSNTTAPRCFSEQAQGIRAKWRPRATCRRARGFDSEGANRRVGR